MPTTAITEVTIGQFTIVRPFLVSISSLPLGERIKIAGFSFVQLPPIDLQRQDFAACFPPIPPTQTGQREVVLVKFREELTPTAIIAQLDQISLRPATVDELVAFAFHFPGARPSRHHIAALGSSIHDEDGRCYYPCVNGSGGKWILYFERVTPDMGSFAGFWHFAAVHK